MKADFSYKEFSWMVIGVGMLMPHVSDLEKMQLGRLEGKLTALLNKAREEDKKKLEEENVRRKTS